MAAQVESRRCAKREERFDLPNESGPDPYDTALLSSAYFPARSGRTCTDLKRGCRITKARVATMVPSRI